MSPCFFVLSGLVIAYSLRSHLVDPPNPAAGEPDALTRYRPMSIGRFMGRRFARLTPPYYAAIVVALLFAAGAAAQGGHPYEPGYAPFTVPRFATHLVYAQELAGFVNFNDVLWTLSLEMQFYFVFAVLVVAYQWLTRRMSPTIARYVVYGVPAVAGLAWPFGLFDGDERAIWIGPLWYSFAAGILIFARWQRQIPSLAVVAYLGALTVAPLVYSQGARFVVTAAITTVALWFAVERDRMGRWLADRVSQFLGRVSYSLYLLHTPVLGATLVAVGVIGERTWAWQAFGLVAAVIASLLAAEIGYRLVEAPAIAWSKRLKASGSGSGPATTTSGPSTRPAPA